MSLPFTIDISRKNSVNAFVGSRLVGQATAWQDSNDDFVILKSAVRPAYQRRGIARAMYETIERDSGKQLLPATSLSDEAFEFWKRYRPEAVATDLRHWKEQLIGAKVVHSGRAGVITSASGSIAMVSMNRPTSNGSTYAIPARLLNDALFEAGGKTLPLKPDASERRGVVFDPELPCRQQSLVPAPLPIFCEDVPAQEWLEEHIDYARSRPLNRFGVPYMGKQTGYFSAEVEVAVAVLATLRGQRREQDTPRLDDLSAIKQMMSDTSKLPLLPDGKEYAPYIEVSHDGQGWVAEGNHRIMAAAALDWPTLPVQIRYFDGGERIKNGPLHPSKLSCLAERQAEADANEEAVEEELAATSPRG